MAEVETHTMLMGLSREARLKWLYNLQLVAPPFNINDGTAVVRIRDDGELARFIESYSVKMKAEAEEENARLAQEKARFEKAVADAQLAKELEEREAREAEERVTREKEILEAAERETQTVLDTDEIDQ